MYSMNAFPTSFLLPRPNFPLPPALSLPLESEHLTLLSHISLTDRPPKLLSGRGISYCEHKTLFTHFLSPLFLFHSPLFLSLPLSSLSPRPYNPDNGYCYSPAKCPAVQWEKGAIRGKVKGPKATILYLCQIFYTFRNFYENLF